MIFLLIEVLYLLETWIIKVDKIENLGVDLGRITVLSVRGYLQINICPPPLHHNFLLLNRKELLQKSTKRIVIFS